MRNDRQRATLPIPNPEDSTRQNVIRLSARKVRGQGRDEKGSGVNKLITLSIALTLCACMTVPEDTRGAVYAHNGDTVTIRGQYSPKGAKPTQAMVRQAKDACPNATFLSATPSNLHQYDYTFLYLFKC